MTADYCDQYYQTPVARLVFAPVRTRFRALAESFVPEAAELGERGWAEVEAIIEQFLAARPAAVRRQVALLLRLVDLLSLVRHGRRVASLDTARRLRFLESLQDAPILLLRRGIWGVRTLAFMGYYGRPQAAVLIGYRADARGWEARR